MDTATFEQGPAPKITIQFTANGSVLVFGPIPMDLFGRIAGLADKKAGVDTDLARMAGATFAFGTPKQVEADKAAYAAGALAREEQRAPGASPALTQWLATGERGVSSNTIVQHLTGIKALGGWHSGHPHDPADFRRCHLLLEACPELMAKFIAMGSLSPAWAALVGRWAEILHAMDAEAPNWRNANSKWSAPRTYALMQEILKP
jgi:hypothetical protein